MSILVEVAEKAEVSVEGVVRVLTREPVSEAVQERVLAVLDDLSPEQTRVLQRFVLAALHDELPRPVEGAAVREEPAGAAEPVREEPAAAAEVPREEPAAPTEAVREEPAAAAEAVREEPAPAAEAVREEPAAAAEAVREEPAPAAEAVREEPAAAAEAPRDLIVSGEEAAEPLPVSRLDTEHLVRLSSVLEELAEAVRDLRREKDTERRERVDDLAVLIDLISTGWQGIERRLGRMERQLGQLETGRQPPPTPRAPAPEPAAPAPTPPEVEAAPVKRRGQMLVAALPLAMALALIGAVAAAIALSELFAGGSDVASVVSARENPVGVTTTPEEAAEASSTTSARTTAEPRPRAASTTVEPRSRAASTTGTTSAVLGTSATEPKPAPEPAPKPPPARAPTAAERTTTVAPEGSGFRPTRDWAWAPVDGADYYAVQFLRNGKSFYRAYTEEPRLTLPDSVVFRPGSYRWTVRPGYGARSANQLGPPIVDSSFTVA